MSTSDPVHFGQTTSRTCCTFGGEKWLECAFSYLGTHTRAIVLYDDHRFGIADLGPNRESPVRGHGVHRMNDILLHSIAVRGISEPRTPPSSISFESGRC